MSQPWEIIEGDARAALAALPAGHFHAAVCSPPYHRLRSYLPRDHPSKPLELGGEDVADCFGWATGRRCGCCYVCRMTAVFREVRRVLRDDGTLWVNVAPSFSSGISKQAKQHPADGIAVEGLDDETFALRDDLSPAEIAEVLSGLAAYQLDQAKVR
jgi:DNA modification methylase